MSLWQLHGRAAVERDGTPRKRERLTHEFAGDLSSEGRVQNRLSTTARAGIFRGAPPVGILKVQIDQQEWRARCALPSSSAQATPEASMFIDDARLSAGTQVAIAL